MIIATGISKSSHILNLGGTNDPIFLMTAITTKTITYNKNGGIKRRMIFHALKKASPLFNWTSLTLISFIPYIFNVTSYCFKLGETLFFPKFSLSR